MSDWDIISHETNEFAEEDEYENDMDCITQQPESNNFVLLKLAEKKTVKYFVGLI